MHFGIATLAVAHLALGAIKLGLVLAAITLPPLLFSKSPQNGHQLRIFRIVFPPLWQRPSTGTYQPLIKFVTAPFTEQDLAASREDELRSTVRTKFAV
jgi:hypothetical protein